MSTTHTKIISLILIITLVSTVMAIDFSDHTVSKPRGYKTVHMPRTTTTAPTLLPTCIVTPTPMPVIAPSGQDISKYHYRVMALDGIDQMQIRMALQYIPNFFSFEIVADDPLQYEWNNGYPIPQTARLITIFDGTMHGYVHPKAMGYYYGEGRCTIVYLEQDPYHLSWIIEHECLHEALRGGTINQDKQPEFVDRWNTWMQERAIGFWSGDERAYVERGWTRLQQDFLISQCLTL